MPICKVLFTFVCIITNNIMQTKLKLLPHWCQITGYSYLIIFTIAVIYTAIIALTDVTPENNGLVRITDEIHSFLLGHWAIVGPINFIMIFLAIFSREKVEDEMTREIRLRTLVYLVLFLFLIHILLYLPSHTAAWDVTNEIRNLFMEDFGVMTIAYAFLYKIMIGINKWRMLYEE